uniref:C2 DOCK-type domain-containing protein n=1 Tax=Amphimedon queenslandica TaxID=400682 RepID=A0A1X7SYM2_AMPQE
WIPLLQGAERKELKLGEFNLAVTTDHPPAAYSQLSSDVHLPNLKWIDNHKPVFKVHLKMISSIYPQDANLHDFSESSTPEVQRASFSSLASIISNVHSLKLQRDKHNRDIVLASFIQYVFVSPLPPSNLGLFDPAHVTAQRSGSFSLDDDPMNKRSASMRHSRNIVVQQQSVEVLRDLLASHDSDIRYTNFRSRISSIYLPLLSIVMDNYHRLYKGADGWENLTNTFDRNTEVRRSVVIKEGSDGSLEIDDEESRYDQILGPASTRNLLICFLWVLKNIDPMLIKHWWSTLSISRLNLFLNVLDLCVACFEYKGKRNLMNQLSGASVATSKNSNNMKDQLANAILSGVGTAKERLQRRRQQSQDPAAGGSLRWGKTVWQAAAEYTEKPKVDIEVDAMIESSLAGEASLVVLDILELLIGNTLHIENLQSVLGKNLEVLLHLMLCNQSIEVSRCVFASQRAIVRKFPELILYEETEQCAELCARLLKHCSSSMADVRAWACASLYLLMRQNYEIGQNFARVKVQVTVALSSIVAGSTKSFNEHHLRRSLKTLILYAEGDDDMYQTSFPEQVKELAINLHRILLDTDHEMLMDLMYRISKGYQTSPDLRLTWLQNMAKQHNEVLALI